MKMFQPPVIEVVTFSVEDIIATSNGGTILPDDEF